MSILLYAAGAIVVAIGAAMIGYGIPINEFSFGNTLIIAGTVAMVGGLILGALGVVVRELRHVAEAYSLASARPARPADVEGAVRVQQPATVRVPFPPKPAAPARQDAAPREPREETIEEPPADFGPPPFLAPASRMPSKTSPKTSPAPAPASILAPMAPVQAAPVAATMPTPLVAHPQPRPEEEVFGAPALPNPDAAPALDDDDAPPAWPPEGRAPREFAPLYPGRNETADPSDLDEPPFAPRRPEASSRPLPSPAAEKTESNYFDAMWPADRPTLGQEPPDPAIADEAAHDEPDPVEPSESAEAEPGQADDDSINEEPRTVPILKSGVVDGMGYTLYVDGSIEAELPQGTLRFASINELRAHLEKTA